jgi:hypothetical protein
MQVLEGENFFHNHHVIGKLGTGNSTVWSVLRVSLMNHLGWGQSGNCHEGNSFKA